ncbi:hypothetical protein BDV24DRAFT_170279 [Aspergillus arachidicola]|uniref:Uncharacterized protein n=1 Tax=Aspergillus arachidicola TaxID=656916 RepID=A0A5N6XME5_9EURO|nr:hypothetical protein BDV24DRAFT_170279 [Aspergillus arachidicola]
MKIAIIIHLIVFTLGAPSMIESNQVSPKHGSCFAMGGTEHLISRDSTIQKLPLHGGGAIGRRAGVLSTMSSGSSSDLTKLLQYGAEVFFKLISSLRGSAGSGGSGGSGSNAGSSGDNGSPSSGSPSGESSGGSGSPSGGGLGDIGDLAGGLSGGDVLGGGGLGDVGDLVGGLGDIGDLAGGLGDIGGFAGGLLR